MEEQSLSGLLREDGDRLQHALQAGESIEKDRGQSIRLLQEECGSLLLRYNAACGRDPMRQALADCLAATARDTLALLRAAGAEKQEARRENSGWAMLLLLLAVAAGAAGVMLTEESRLAGVLCAAGALVLAFAAGRLWFRRRQVTVRPTLDSEALWLGLLRVSETMDQKIQGFCERAGEWTGPSAPCTEELRQEEVQLFGELLEALYAENGTFALRQLEKIRPCLRALGIETVDYSAENAAAFELMPSKRPGLTLRPALMAGEKLLLPGRATEAVR